MRHDPATSRTADLHAALLHHPEADALRQVWQALPAAARDDDRTPATQFAAREAAWARLQRTIADPQRVPFVDEVQPADDASVEVVPGHVVRPINTAPSRTIRSRRPSSRWLVAASVTALLTVTGVAFRAVPVTYDAPRSEAARAVTLADGSTLWLAPGSRVSVPRALGWPGMLRASSRDVQLTGRAFFAVQRDGRAFTVRTANATVSVLGTRFEVHGAAAGTQVTVEEGRVAVAPDRLPAQRLVLTAGQRVDVRAAVASLSPVRTVTAARVGSWRLGGLSALDESLDAVLAELTRRFDVEITHAADVDGAVTVSLFYPATPTVETVLGDICTAQGLTFRRTSRGFHVMRGEGRP